MKRHLKLISGVMFTMLAGLVIAPTIASAAGLAWEQGNTGRARIAGVYVFSCQAGTAFPDPELPDPPLNLPKTLLNPGAPQTYFSGIISSPGACAGSTAKMNAGYPAAGNAWVWARVSGVGGAGLVGKLPSATAVASDSLSDSLATTVNRGVAGQVTISITGRIRHYNVLSSPILPVSTLKITVYPDTTSANNRTGAIASGTGSIVFGGSSTVKVTGFFNPGDVVAPIVVGDGDDYQLSTAPALSKVVLVPNAATACVVMEADPDAMGTPTAPGSTPITLALLASLLLAGATWFLVGRRRTDLA